MVTLSQPIKLGLLGNGISRSRARTLHELLGELSGVSVSYLPMDMAQRSTVSVADELQRCQAEGYRGINVTHPYKREAYQQILLMDDFPEGLTSVNTVIFEDGRFMATNTDYSGFCRGFRRQFGNDTPPGSVLMLGAGGVGLAIAYGLKTLGCTELVIHDKDPALAQTIASRLDSAAMTVRLAGQDLVAEMQAADGLINATPLGMFQYPGSAFPEAGFKQQQWAFDAVYTPENTAFLGACRTRGIATLSGFRLFFYQGLDAFGHFTGLSPDEKQVEKEFLQRYPLE